MVNEKDPETGTPILILQGMTKSLHEKATLGKTLRGLLGTNDLPKSLDLEKLVGTQGFATVIHTDSNDGRTYANILKVKKAAANQPVVKIPTGWHAPNVKPVRTSTASASTAGTAGTTGTAGATNDEETVF
jgi:hypothetical protein